MPDELGPLRRQVEVLSELGRPREALALVYQGLGRVLNDAGLLYMAVSLHIDLEQYEEALQAAGQLVAATPDDAGALALLAMARRHQRDYPGSMEAAAQALNLDPHEEMALFELSFGKILQAEVAAGSRRRTLLLESRELARQLEQLSPYMPSGATLLAMSSAYAKDWLSHEAELARALAANPQDDFAHSVRLLGLRLRGKQAVLTTELLERLKNNPESEFSRNELRSQFGALSWLRSLMSRPLLLLLGVVALVSFPVLLGAIPAAFMMWRLALARREPQAYAAAFTPQERRAMSYSTALFIVPVPLLVLLLWLETVRPLFMTSHSVWYVFVCILALLGLVGFCLPAFSRGEGGLFGRRDALAPQPRLTRRPLTPLRVLPVVLLCLPLPFLLGTVLVGLWGTSQEIAAGEWQKVRSSLALIGAFLLVGGVLSVILVRQLEKARYGQPLVHRHSWFDGVVALLAALSVVGLVAAVVGSGKNHALQWGEVPFAGSPAHRVPYWAMTADDTLGREIRRRNPADSFCRVPQSGRWVVVAVPDEAKNRSSSTLFLQTAPGKLVPEAFMLRTCLYDLDAPRGTTLVAFETQGIPTRLVLRKN